MEQKKCALREPPVAQTIHELQTPSDNFVKNAFLTIHAKTTDPGKSWR